MPAWATHTPTLLGPEQARHGLRAPDPGLCCRRYTLAEAPGRPGSSTTEQRGPQHKGPRRQRLPPPSRPPRTWCRGSSRSTRLAATRSSCWGTLAGRRRRWPVRTPGRCGPHTGAETGVRRGPDWPQSRCSLLPEPGPRGRGNARGRVSATRGARGRGGAAHRPADSSVRSRESAHLTVGLHTGQAGAGRPGSRPFCV